MAGMAATAPWRTLEIFLFEIIMAHSDCITRTEDPAAQTLLYGAEMSHRAMHIASSVSFAGSAAHSQRRALPDLRDGARLLALDVEDAERLLFALQVGGSQLLDFEA